MTRSFHWHLGYSKTACGILAYKTWVPGEFDTALNGRIDCADQLERVTCGSCQRVMSAKPTPKVLDAIVDKVLAYKPKPKSAPAKRRKRRKAKLAKKAR